MDTCNSGVWVASIWHKEKIGRTSVCFQILNILVPRLEETESMDSLSVSLVNQYLSSTNLSVAEEFKSRYQPGKAEVTWMDVVFKWKEEQLLKGLVCRHLKQVAPNLALEFSQSHSPTFVDVPETLLEFIEVEMLSRNLAYQLLQKVSPTLAPEFKRNHF